MAELVESSPPTSEAPVSHPTTATGRVRIRLRRMFYGHRPAAVAFQAGLFAIDIAAVTYFVATTFVDHAGWMQAVDLALGILLTLEILGRMLAHRHPMHYLDNAAAVIDIAVVVSLLVSALGGNLGFLRVLRTVRLFRSYNVLGQLKRQFAAVRRNEEVIHAALNFSVFVFVISSLVFVTQRGINPEDPRLSRRALLLGRGAHHHGVRRRHADGQRHRRAALDRHDDRRDHAVPALGAGGHPPRQGAVLVPAVRPAPARLPTRSTARPAATCSTFPTTSSDGRWRRGCNPAASRALLQQANPTANDERLDV